MAPANPKVGKPYVNRFRMSCSLTPCKRGTIVTEHPTGGVEGMLQPDDAGMTFASKTEDTYQNQGKYLRILE